MSATPSTNESPMSAPVQPLHNPTLAAHVVVPQAPLGNVANQAPGMGAKALLAKRMAKVHNPSYISPTDNLMTPCTQKLSAAKKKHFNNTGKPVQLFALPGYNGGGGGDEQIASNLPSEQKDRAIEVDNENPF